MADDLEEGVEPEGDDEEPEADEGLGGVDIVESSTGVFEELEDPLDPDPIAPEVDGASPDDTPDDVGDPDVGGVAGGVVAPRAQWLVMATAATRNPKVFIVIVL